MKKFLFLLFILILLGLIGGAVFLFTFDANRFRPLMIEKVEAFVGNPVSLGNISLTWQDGIALAISDLAIYTGPEASGKPAVELDSASAVVEWLPLLQGKLRATSILLERPKIHAFRHVDGKIRILGIDPPPPLTQPSPLRGEGKGEGKVLPQALPLLIDKIRIENGVVNFKDQMTSPSRQIEIKDLDISLRNVSLIRPIDFHIAAAVASGKQNITIDGQFRAVLRDKASVFEDVRAEIDLDAFRLEEVRALLPEARDLEAVGGNLSFQMDEMELTPSGLDQLDARINVSGGKLGLKTLAMPLEGIILDAQAQKNNIYLKNFSAKMGEGTFELSGTVNQYRLQPQGNMELQAANFKLEDLIPAPSENSPQLKGRASLSFQGQGAGKTLAEILPLAAGQGRLTIQEPVVANLNLLREVFSRLSLLPGLTDTLMQRLPADYRQKLEVQDTFLQPIDLEIFLERGHLMARNLVVISDSFEMTGTAAIGILNRHIQIQALVSVEPDLSKALIQSVHELQYLSDPQGRLQIPVIISGIPPQVRFLPDLQYVGARLAVAKTREVLGDILRPKSTSSEPDQGTEPADSSAPPTEGAQEEQEDPYQTLFGGLIQQALKQRSRDGS